MRALPTLLPAVLPFSAALLLACSTPPLPPPAPLLAAARPGSLADCSALAGRLQYPRAQFAAPERVAAGTLTVGGQPVLEHCLVSGRLNERVSAVDGQTYAIGFQMRLPLQWNGRFFHQGNGGLDGIVAPAVGLTGGGGPASNALQMGFAVLSSDAGHSVRQLPGFGRDPQARLDYGYQAIAALTPMARAVIAAAYGREPDRSYFGGCSNGGRHALMAAARYAADYDGILAGNPGFQLPRAALAQLYGAQQFQSVATSADLASALTLAERQLLSRSVLARCDALDGATDGIVADTAACQRSFDAVRDVPSCAAARDGSCLSAEQKEVLARVFAGGRDSAGRLLYAAFPWDAGVAGNDWANWKFVSSVTNRDPVAMAFVFQTPPAQAVADPKAFALAFPIDEGLARIQATAAPYDEAAMSFMVPPGLDDLGALRRRGGKLIAYHGVADGVFSASDSAAWMQRLQARHGEAGAGDFARLFLVPGMNHCQGGPATDQFDLLTPLVRWVEQGVPPPQVTATARGPGHTTPNAEVPAAWGAARSRPLCPWPQVARYKGSGNIDTTDSFECR